MTGRLLLLGTLVASLSACDDGVPVKRGFGSRQISQLRDPTFKFNGSLGDVVLYSLGTDPLSTWMIDIVTGSAQPLDPASPPSTPSYVFPSDPNVRFHCSFVSIGPERAEFRIDDGQTGQRTTIDAALPVATCPTEADPTITIWRPDGNGHITLWTGPYDDLQMAPIDLAVLRLFGGMNRTDTSVDVLAGLPGQPDAIGIYAVDLATFAATELVPPSAQSAAWAEGATPSGALDSATLFVDPNDWSGIVPFGAHFLYWRTISDGGGETMFVGPLGTGPAHELALFHRDAYGPDRVNVWSSSGADSATAPLTPVWRRWDSSDLFVWDDARQRLITCTATLTAPVGEASHDRSKLVLYNRISGADTYDGPGPLVLVDLSNPAAGSAPCTTLATADVSAAGLAPDGSALFWLAQPPYPAVKSELHLAAADGSAARLLGTDLIEGPPNQPRFVGPSQLEIDINADLVWIDTDDDLARTHAIAERVIGGTIDRGRWLIAGYDTSTPDGTAQLGIVNRDTGDKRPISPAVAKFFSPDIANYSGTGYQVLPSPFRTAADGLRIVYLVHGRNPSAQDGLWVATINASDIP